MTDPILENLNPQQLEAVVAPDGPVLVIAGAGSGKTRVITRRIAYLVRQDRAQPHEIFAATFTNKAADEMKRRVGELIGAVSPRAFNIATFHSLCARILRRDSEAAGLRHNFTICDEADQLRAIRLTMKDLAIDSKTVSPSDAQYFINQAKMRMMSPEDIEGEPPTDARAEYYLDIYKGYEALLAANGSVDFEDLIWRVVRLWRSNSVVLADYRRRFKHVLVDEYQDTNAVQFEMVRLLAGEHRHLMVVGDEDQSIYSWRGADIGNLLQFEQHFPGASIVRLEQNYRSTGNILAAASTVIARNTERLGKTLFTTGPAGAPIYVTGGPREADEARTVILAIEDLARRRGFRYGEIAIFYRVAALSRVFEDALREFDIPHRVIGGIRFYDRAEVKDLIAYLNVAANPDNTIHLQRIINTPRRGIGSKTIDTINDTARTNGISWFEAMRRTTTQDRVPAAAAKSIRRLVSEISIWNELAQSATPADLLKRILQDTAFIEHLGDPNAFEVQSKTENVEELVNAAAAFTEAHPDGTLQDYLEQISLITSGDEPEGESQVSLMTLHSAKGLEFRVVFIVGMEEGVFPNPRAVFEEGRMEEERRLFYVGITRARELLVLSRSGSRLLYGETRYNGPSPFLSELPRDILEPLDLAEMDVTGSDHDAGDAESHPVPLRTPAPQAARPAAPAGRTTGSHMRAGKYQLGDRVRHAILGEGIITSINGGGNNASMLIEFEGGEQHQMLVKYARLEVMR